MARAHTAEDARTMKTREGTPGTLPSRRSLWALVAIGIVGLGIGLETCEATEIRSARLSGSNLQLDLATDWDRRYRIESSGDLLDWKTILVTEPSQGTSLAAGIPIAGTSSGFLRASLFEWEELHAEWLLARQRWRAKGLTSYQFECQWSCHCPFWSWARVTVRNGIVTEVVAVDTGEPLPKEQWSTYLTIEGLFEWIESQRGLHPVELRAAFDPALGYLVSGYADISRMIADEELGFTLRALSF